MKNREIQLKSLLLFGILALPGIAQAQGPARDQELDRAQGAMAKAMTNYYRALQSGGAPDLNALEVQLLGPATNELSNVLHERRQQELSAFSNKTFFSDGTVMDTAEVKKLDLKEGEIPKPPANRPGGLGGSTSASPPLKATQIGGSSSGKGAKPPEWVIDGSQVPKEISFSGDSTPPKDKAVPAGKNKK